MNITVQSLNKGRPLLDFTNQALKAELRDEKHFSCCRGLIIFDFAKSTHCIQLDRHRGLTAWSAYTGLMPCCRLLPSSSIPFYLFGRVVPSGLVNSGTSRAEKLLEYTFLRCWEDHGKGIGEKRAGSGGWRCLHW